MFKPTLNIRKNKKNAEGAKNAEKILILSLKKGQQARIHRASHPVRWDGTFTKIH
jgi:hypothetical protein